MVGICLVNVELQELYKESYDSQIIDQKVSKKQKELWKKEKERLLYSKFESDLLEENYFFFHNTFFSLNVQKQVQILILVT